MEAINFLVAILALLVSTTLFCLIMTTDWGWGPIVYISTFLGGIVLMGWAGVACLDIFKD